MLRKNFGLLAGTSLAVIAAIPFSAHAQSAENSSGVSDIIVTAQKREQSIQDVPIAVTALGEEALQANRVASVSDLTGLAPGLIARRNPGGLGSPQFTMRGISASPSVPSQDGQISMYLDGVYIGGARGSVGDLPDIARVEVLRGPQGTLFGRNATAGAVQLITRDPTGEFSVRQDITVGNQDQFRTRTSIDTPAFGPFSAYVTYVHDEKRGDVRNLGAGTCFDRTNPFNKIATSCSPDWLGGKNFESVFAALRYDNGGDFTLTYKFDWLDGSFSQDARVVPVIGNDFIGGVFKAILAAQPVGGGAYGPVTVPANFRRPKAYNNAWTQPGSQSIQGHNLTAELRLSDNLSLKNVFAYRKTRVFSASAVAGLNGLEYTQAAKDFYTAPQAFLGGLSYAQALGADGNAAVGTYFAAYDGEQYGRYHQYSDELQLNYTSDIVNLTAGALYYSSNETNSAFPGFRPNFTWTPVPYLVPLGGILDSRSSNKSYAAYAQAEVNITPELQLVLGGRVTKDKKTPSFERGGTFVGTRTDGEIVGTTFAPSKTFKKTKPTYAIGLNYDVTPDILVYGKYSTAFLSGGSVADIVFKPETVKSWEAGIKSEFLDRKVRLNLSVYDAVYGDPQAAISASALATPRFDINLAVINNGKLKAKGVELDLNVAPAEGLTFGGTMGYTDVKLIDPAPEFAGGKTLKQAGIAKWLGSGYVSYITPPLFDEATMMFRLDATYQSRTRIINDVNYATNVPAFAPYAFAPTKTIVNGRVALRDIDMNGGANLEIGLWARNLFDSKKPLYAFQFGTFFFTASYEQARTYGLDVIVRFNP
ncbi:MAG: TonB-dependent receptor [Novosphingobium sp.]|nr:TonB-dependent receptor [Novosphingobium sp.]